MSEEKQSFAGRIKKSASGLFRPRGETQAAVGKGSEPGELQHLRTQVHELAANEEKLKEKLQQLELEKVLMKNFVDRVCSADDSPSNAMSSEEGQQRSMKECVLELQGANAAATVRIQALEREREELDHQLTVEQKKTRAYEAALEKSSTELHEVDERLLELKAKEKQIVELQEKLQQVESKGKMLQETIEGLMGKVELVTKEKTELATMLQKTVEVSDSNSSELADCRTRLTAAYAELVKLRPIAETAATATASYEKLQGEIQEAPLVKELREQLSAAAQEMAELRLELDVHRAGTNFALEALQDAFEVIGLKAEAQAADVRTVVAASLNDLQSKLDWANEQKENLEEDFYALEGELNETRQRNEEVEVNFGPMEAELAEARELIPKLHTQVEELENESKIKARMNTNLSRDLQQQIIRLEGELRKANERTNAAPKLVPAPMVAPVVAPVHQSATGAPSPATEGTGCQQGSPRLTVDPEAETIQLVQRVANMQEKLWAMESTKKVYEEEIVRLNKDIEGKKLVITNHFIDEAAKRSSRFFGPKPEEVHCEIQTMLEKASMEISELRNELAKERSAREVAENIIAEAQRQGVLILEEEGEGEDEGPQARALQKQKSFF